MKLEIPAKDWNAIRLFVRTEEATLRDNHGIPGRKAQTWEREAQLANPEAFRIFEAARKAIIVARVAR